LQNRLFWNAARKIWQNGGAVLQWQKKSPHTIAALQVVRGDDCLRLSAMLFELVKVGSTARKDRLNSPLQQTEKPFKAFPPTRDGA